MLYAMPPLSASLVPSRSQPVVRNGTDASATNRDSRARAVDLVHLLERVLVERQELVVWLEEQAGGLEGGPALERAALLDRLQRVSARQEVLLAELHTIVRPPDAARGAPAPVPGGWSA